MFKVKMKDATIDIALKSFLLIMEKFLVIFFNYGHISYHFLVFLLNRQLQTGNKIVSL